MTKNKELAYQYFRGKVPMEKFCNHFYSTQEELESGQFGCYILSQSSQENIESTFFDIRQPYVISPYATTHKLIAAFQQMIIRNIACVHFVNWNGEHDVVLCTSNSSVLYNVYGMFYDADSMTSGVLINRPDILKMNIIPNKFAGTICVPLQNIISVSYL